MSIFTDAGAGALTKDKLKDYLKTNPKILNEQDPSTGQTPLAIAAVGGYPEEVELLLKRGAQADGRSKDGATPLLLAAWQTTKNRPKIIQLLLAKTPRKSVDSTIDSAGNKTPLMHAIDREDIDSIRMLLKAGAQLNVKNSDGFTAKEMAKMSKNKAVYRAIKQSERFSLGRLSSAVVTVLLVIVSWVNTVTKGVVRRVFRLNPDRNSMEGTQKLNEKLGASEDTLPTKEELVENVDELVKEQKPLENFFKDKEFMQKLTRNAAELEQDKTTDLGSPSLLHKTIKVSMHQQVFFCDDSSSTKRHNRWENQRDLVKRIAQITTRILPEGEGVALRFINQDVSDKSSNLTFQGLGEMIDSMSWDPKGDTEIGTTLVSKILEPLVYKKLEPKSLARPLLVSIITDGMPGPKEPASTLGAAIAECGSKLEAVGYPRDSVKFLIAQVGTADGATKFLATLRENTEIEPVTFIVAETLDARLAEFHDNDRELDRWLIETLFAPISKSEAQK